MMERAKSTLTGMFLGWCATIVGLVVGRLL